MALPSAVKDEILRRSNLLHDVEVVMEGDEDTRQSGLVSLGSGIVYDIRAAFKNGSAISEGTDYNWSTHQSNVEIIGGFAQNDHYVFTVQRKLPSDATDDYIDEALQVVKSKLRLHYEDTATDPMDQWPTVHVLVAGIAIGRLRQLTAEGVALESAWYRSGRDLEQAAFDHLAAITTGSAVVLDSDGDVVSRVSGSLVGGFDTGAVDSRRDWRSKLTDYDSIFVAFMPFDEDTDNTA